jgi:hypothetical protein
MDNSDRRTTGYAPKEPEEQATRRYGENFRSELPSPMSICCHDLAFFEVPG